MSLSPAERKEAARKAWRTIRARPSMLTLGDGEGWRVAFERFAEDRRDSMLEQLAEEWGIGLEGMRGLLLTGVSETDGWTFDDQLVYVYLTVFDADGQRRR